MPNSFTQLFAHGRNNETPRQKPDQKSLLRRQSTGALQRQKKDEKIKVCAMVKSSLSQNATVKNLIPNYVLTCCFFNRCCILTAISLTDLNCFLNLLYCTETRDVISFTK